MNWAPSLEGKHIWITGGAGYLGSGITEALDHAGVQVLCIDLPGRAEALVREKGLTRTVPVAMDLTDTSALHAFVEKTIGEQGIPDGLAHLAFASSAGRRLAELSVDDFNRTMRDGLGPTFLLCREVAEHMRARKSGSVVLFASMYGLVAPDPRAYVAPLAPNPIDYGASKAAILQMARYFAVHYGPDGLRFNCVTPGPFPNPATQTTHPDVIDRLKEKTPLGRIGRSSEIVGPTVFLLSDAASYVTGHSLVVDGGWTAW